MGENEDGRDSDPSNKHETNSQDTNEETGSVSEAVRAHTDVPRGLQGQVALR